MVFSYKIEKPIDIVIPVYNGFDFLPEFFAGIFKNTSLDYNLIIVDDCSTDKRVCDYLESISERDNVQLITNRENLGFVKSVNKGINLTRNHFVILNTDTLVPKYWLERLMFPIFKLDKTASTTPFTNSGTICSFPDFLKDNLIFKNLDVEELDMYFRQVNPLKNYIELPTGVGFCMGINRDAVKRVGLFDEETFKKGYGEENDWCMRAKKAGYSNVIVPNLFVYHKHGGSFDSKERKQLMENNLRQLFAKHPLYPFLVGEFIPRDPLKKIRDFLILLVSSKYDKIDPVLIIDNNTGGGANNYRKELIEKKLKNNEKVLLLTFNLNNNNYNLTYQYKHYKLGFILEDFQEINELFKYIKINEIFINNLVSFKNPAQILKNIKEIKDKYNCRLCFCCSLFLSCLS